MRIMRIRGGSGGFLGMMGVAALVLALAGSNAFADYQTATFVMDQSNAMQNGVIYGTVQIETYDGTGTGGGGLQAGQARLSVTINDVAAYGNLSNFGMDKFGFNSTAAISSNQITGPSGWSFSTNQQMSGFGNFLDFEQGSGNSRVTNGTFLISGLGTDANLNNFEVTSTGSTLGPAYFSAHVAGFDNQPTSHFIGGNTPLAPPVPEPASMVLLSFAAVGFAGYCWRARK